MKAFGAAPAIRQIRNMKKIGVASSVSGATLWYYFRNYYPLTFSVLWIVFCIIPYYTSDTINGHLLYGGCLSITATLFVVLSYIQIVPWRKHPSPLILYRTISNLLFSAVIVINAFHVGHSSPNSHSNYDDELSQEESRSCQSMSFVTQFAMFTGECWLLTFPVDLLSSLTNPFSSYKANLKKYHLLVWSAGFLNALALVGNTNCQGIFSAGVCWLKATDAESSCFWGYYAGW